MRKYHIGLDFGTYQTKACVYDLTNNVHEFFLFPSTGTFFVPSRVGLKKDGSFEYGKPSGEPVAKDYYYFKIAAAEDVEFQVETFKNNPRAKHITYQTNEFEPYTPEFLSAIYITDILFVIKEQYLKRGAKKESKGGLLGRLLKQTSEEQVQFTVQIGIPTEWSQLKNLRRKRKFENILMISELLQQKFKTREAFVQAKADVLIGEVKKVYGAYTFQGTEQFYEALNKLGISVFPETAAGLTFIVKTSQLLPGHYAIMDIGGGSTDISFFMVESGNNIKYLASESYIIASNNVYKLMCKDQSIVSLHEAEKEVQRLLQSKGWEKNDLLTDALVAVRNDLNKLVYKLFNRRVHHYRQSMTKKYDGKPIILYGGGSRLPCIKSGWIEIHDNGLKNAIVDCIQMEKQSIDRYASGINVLPANRSWLKELSVLVVALGLSYIKPDSFANWFGEDDYHSEDGELVPKKGGPNKWGGGSGTMVQHPYNEDYYIYDVLSSKWN